jgi:hypothetical protein
MVSGDRSMSGRFSLGAEVKHSPLTGGAMLYDASRANNFAPAWFDPTYWKSRGELDGVAAQGGRGTTHFFKTAGSSMVLRHYRRGGFAARFSHDRYISAASRRSPGTRTGGLPLCP